MRLNLGNGSTLAATASLLILGGCMEQRAVQPLPPAPLTPAEADQADGLLAGPQASATIVEGEAARPVSIPSAQPAPAPGDIRFNFPNADVRVVAKAILGDLLRLEYSVDPSVNGTVSVVTASPVARSAVLDLFERALRASNLALVPQGRGFQITSTQTAGAIAPIGQGATGYGTESIRLQFVGAEQMKRLLDQLLPNTVTSADPGSNTLVIAGTTGQRTAVRDILRQFDVNWLRSTSFALFVPKRTDSRLIAPELDKLINDASAPTKGLVRLIAMDRLNGILAISAQPQYLEDVRRWVEILDREGENNERRLFVYPVQNGRARDLAKTLNTAFGGGSGGGGESAPADPLAVDTPAGGEAQTQSANRPAGVPTRRTAAASPADRSAANGDGGTQRAAQGDGVPDVTISADENNNAVVVFGTARDYAVVERALRQLDVVPMQVMIEAAITEVALTDNLRFGVQWNFQTGDSNFALTEGTDANPTRILPGFSYFFSDGDIRGTLNALERRTNVKVISAPKLLVLNNQTAALQVGDQVPITTQTAVGIENANSAVVNSVEYRDTGVILKVTPRVNASGMVLLDIAQEVSDVAPNQTSGIDSPTISTRRISTSIAAQDGQVIALGGLFRNSKSFGKNGLPILSRIPVLGGLLFGNSDNREQRTELLVILKPHVLRSVEDGRAVTEELRAKLRTLEPFRTEGRIP